MENTYDSFIRDIRAHSGKGIAMLPTEDEDDRPGTDFEMPSMASMMVCFAVTASFVIALMFL